MIEVLEKDKVYKIMHPKCNFSIRNGNHCPYIICSPINDIKSSCPTSKYYRISFDTNFTICFDGEFTTYGLVCDECGEIIAHDLAKHSSSGIGYYDYLEELTKEDWEEVKKGLLSTNMRYNRKLGKIVRNAV